MKLFLKYVLASILISVSGILDAQDLECVTVGVDFSVDVAESTEMTGSAVITFQGNAFKVVGNGAEVYCDKDTIWTLDFVAKEAYIESVTPEAVEYMNELAPKLTSLKTGSEASFVSPEGQNVRVKIKSLKKSDGKDISSFRPMCDFDSSWVVTDMR